MADNRYYLRSRDVAPILELSPDEVCQLAQTKKLKAKKVGGIWRFRLTDVRVYKRMLERERIAIKLSPFA